MWACRKLQLREFEKGISSVTLQLFQIPWFSYLPQLSLLKFYSAPGKSAAKKNGTEQDGEELGLVAAVQKFGLEGSDATRQFDLCCFPLADGRSRVSSS